jgi:DNA-binding MarR family transcriptional regulator
LQSATKPGESAVDDAESAKKLLEVIPKTMRIIRTELRNYAKAEFSVPQFRILIHVSQGPRNNSQLAEHIGVSVAAMSRMVNGLVLKGLLTRTVGPTDRRQVQLILTEKGRNTVNQLTSAVQKTMALRISRLGQRPKRELRTGLSVLEALFP